MPVRPSRRCEFGEHGQGDRVSRDRTRRPATMSRSRSAFAIGTSSCCRCRKGTDRARPRAAWIAASPICHSGCPVNNQIPDWNDLVYRRQLGGRCAQPALDQQLPGIHRPHLPGAVRGVVHAQHRRQPGHHQNHRMRHRRPRLRRGLDQTRTADGTRPARRSRSWARARPDWPARSNSPAPATTCIVYEKIRQGRRPAALWHSRLQNGKAPHRPPHRADAGRGRDVSLRRRCRRRHVGSQTLLRRLRCGRAGRRRREAARSAGSRPRTQGHPFRDGFPAAAEPPRRRRAGGDRRADPRRAASTSS